MKESPKPDDERVLHKTMFDFDETQPFVTLRNGLFRQDFIPCSMVTIMSTQSGTTSPAADTVAPTATQ